MNRTGLIAGVVLSILLILMIPGAMLLRREWNRKQAHVDQRFPLQELSYCSSNPITPCVVSFGLDAEGNMLVNFLTAGAFYPDFYLKIKTEAGEYIYVCQKAYAFATSVTCTGKAMPVGQSLQFLIFSINEEVLLAHGNFPIIGIALVTPEDFTPPTSTPASVEETPTPSYPSYPSSRP